MLRGRYEVTTELDHVTLPEEICSQIHSTWGSDGVYLLFCPIDNGAYRVIVLTTMPKKIKSSLTISQIDTRGRIPLPEPLINRLKEIGSDSVILIGLLDRFEIWIPWELEEFEKKYEEEFPEEVAKFNAIFAELNPKTK